MAKDQASQLIDAGLWLKMSGDPAGAKQLFERALGSDPENERARALLDGITQTQPALAAPSPGTADTWLRQLPADAPQPIMLWQTEDLDGRYRLVEKLASGGMGDVFKAVHKDLGKRVAIKVMKRELGDTPDFVERFKREAMACSHIGQQNIVDISDFGRTSDGRFYFVMEYLEGQTLSALLKAETQLTTERAVKICLQISRALGAAHSHGIVHRDLKPDNVIILQLEDRPDFVKVLDFGVAKVTNQSTMRDVGTTGSGILMGTPQYMSPEQASALPVDARSDIYSLGLILYELVTGRQVFVGETPSLVIAAHIHQPPPPMTTPPDVAPIPRALEAIVMRMLLKKAAERPQTMAEVMSALEQVLLAPKETLPPAELELPSRSRAPFAVGVAVGVLALATIGWTFGAPPSPAAAIETTALAVTIHGVMKAEAEKAEPPPPPLEPVAALTVTLETKPSNAAVLENNVIIGTTPMKIDWVPGRAAQLVFRRDGFLPSTRTIAPLADLALTVDLAPIPRRVAPQPPQPQPKRALDNLKDVPYE